MQDYRELTGKFDKFVSIGMFEHVGKRFIPVYMRKVAGLLKNGGVGLLHTIAKEVESPTDAWTLRYIFPGGYIPESVGNNPRDGPGRPVRSGDRGAAAALRQDTRLLDSQFRKEYRQDT